MIYSKTEAGLNAIKDRASGLTPRQRSVLIMSDGKRNVEEILKNTAGLGVTASDLDKLVSMQLLTNASPVDMQVQATVPGGLQANPVSAPKPLAELPANPSVSPEQLKALVRGATRALENLLGPSCEPMSLKLEKSKTYDEYAIKIYDIRRVLSSIRSEKIAEEFVQAHLVARGN